MCRALFFALIFISTTVFANTNKESKVLKNGLTLKLGVFLPQEGYGFDKTTYDGLNNNDQVKVDFGVFFDLGTYFYFFKNKSETIGLGINVGWFELGGAKKEFSDLFGVAHINANVLKIGPLASAALSDNIGVDVYFQIRPGFMLTGVGTNDDLEYANGFGINYGTGVAFRFGVFTIGGEYVFGDIKANQVDQNSLFLPKEIKMQTNQARIFIGLKL